MKIKFLGKDPIGQHSTTNYWFSVGMETYALSDCCGDLSLLDCDGGPIECLSDQLGKFHRIFDTLKTAYVPHILE